VEAIAAHSPEGRRVLDDIAVLDAFQEAGAAMKSYQKVHQASCRSLKIRFSGFVALVERSTCYLKKLEIRGSL
jgi:hypothetical protein